MEAGVLKRGRSGVLSERTCSTVVIQKSCRARRASARAVPGEGVSACRAGGGRQRVPCRGTARPCLAQPPPPLSKAALPPTGHLKELRGTAISRRVGGARRWAYGTASGAT